MKTKKQPLWAMFLVPMALAQEAYGRESNAATVADGAVLDEVVVTGRRINKDQRGYNAVYGKDISSVYMGKDAVSRYKGSSPADVFKGMLGVFSGDARNSGALDPNIRGIQGPGRVPLTIDGTEQAITVWRGYNGANNRNYIDPNMIGSITVEKGPSLTRGVQTSVGGGVAVKTLDVDDILTPEQSFGGELKVEAANNTTKARLPTLLTGQDVREVEGWQGVYTDPSLLLDAKTSADNKTLSSRDQAIRLALAARQEHFDIIGAYSFRTQGNYFAGKGGSHNYYPKGEYDNQDFTAYMSNVYKPGSEVPNTSSQMATYLLKSSVYLPHDQSLQLGLRHTKTRYGEIFPSRISLGDLEKADQGVPQWPLSEVALAAYNLLYKWQPEDQPLINFEANLWATRSNSNTYTGGGFPNEPYDQHYSFAPNFTRPGGDDSNTTWDDGSANQIKDGAKIRNTALVSARNNRWGVTLSNVAQLSPNLNMTLGSRLQHERLYSKEKYDRYEFGGFKANPRTGTRRENEYSVNFDWRPTTWLALNAGARHNAYSSFDEGLNRLRNAQEPAAAVVGKILGYTMGYDEKESLEAYRQRYDNDPGITYGGGSLNGLPFPPSFTWNQLIEFTGQSKEEFFGLDDKTPQAYLDILANFNFDSRDDVPSHHVAATWDPDSRKYDQKRQVFWQADADGRVHRENNPFLNGQLEGVDYILKASSGSKVSIDTVNDVVVDKWPKVTKQKDSGWSPLLSATLFLTENARLYARYSEAVRLPSIFESTVGFSASLGEQNARVKPERSRNLEVAYVQDLRDLLAPGRYADVKLAYYRNRIKDVIERDEAFRFSNLDSQRISGLELQGRYDSGRFFSDFSVSATLENKVCDENLALLADPYYGRVGPCVEGGFRSGYLRNMVLPKYSVNWLVGGRFLNDRLEVGGRVLYHQGARNTETQNFYDTQQHSSYFNRPLHWASVVVVDAHVNYKLNRSLQVELAANNLTNRYYLDPLSRSRIPAPGRTVRLSLIGKF